MNFPYGGVPGAPGPPSGASVPGGAGASLPGPPGPHWRGVGPGQKRHAGLITAVSAGILCAVAALVVGIVGLARPSTPANPPAPVASAPTTTAAPETPANTTEADRTLCNAIAPLMGELDRISNIWTGLGPTGTPERDEATPKFVSDVRDWATRIQSITDANPDADPFFQRSLQRLIDDRRLLAADLAAGPFQPYDENIWQDSMSAYGGPLSICYHLGIRW